MQHEWLLENACTTLKELPTALASEKKNSCTNQFFHPPHPLKGQMVHPLYAFNFGSGDLLTSRKTNILLSFSQLLYAN